MSLRPSRLTAAAAILLACGAAHASPVSLDPALSIDTAAVSGVRAQFRSVTAASKFSAVYWDTRPGACESISTRTADCYRNDPAEGFERIGDLDWGTGIWGLRDRQAVQSGAASSTLDFSGTVSTINHGNAKFNESWSDGWGAANTLPGSTPDENWTAWYTGYLRITEQGAYNFGVLYDDGFIFTIYGAGDQAQTISSDFILGGRERLGFDTDLLLTEGLYRFELGAYNRLEAGVVQLAWKIPGEDELTLVPDDRFVQVPLPGTFGLLALGLLPGLRRKNRHR